MVQFAKHVQQVQHVSYEYWEILRDVIGAGRDGFVYNPPHVRTPTPANRKVTRSRGGKSPKHGPTRSLAETVEKAVQEEGKKQPEVLESTGEEEKKQTMGREEKKRSSTLLRILYTRSLG
jgi:hypothetical protein